MTIPLEQQIKLTISVVDHAVGDGSVDWKAVGRDMGITANAA